MKTCISAKEELLNNNRSLWNSWTKINAKSSFYDLEGFKINKNSLKNIELKEMGSVEGKTLLHLQCHFGLDTLSWANKGAKVTGVDFSDEAIKLANDLSNQLNIPAKFICSDIFELSKKLDQKFDIVFTSYGVLTWLHNLNIWGKTISHFLKPGGTFYIIEFHPFVNMLNDDWTEFSEPYFYKGNSICSTQNGSYADTNEQFVHLAYEWPHSMSEIVCSLRQAGLVLEHLNEFSYSSFNCFPNLEEYAPDQYVLKGKKDSMPLMFSIKATYMPELIKNSN
ncbi:class I SAM-dependent methyltransferase [Fluviispira multicolorata]|uniref:Methyltransferase domain-containing protein n=1 Tax=Fluviispira multicolorata TaxID=2654512 RepID=A0A833N3A7_9BACT|nr:class I SAM-dependent methyltransferase [Fluviispira multicolorata]KAB8028089.1 methyltransferase domain-containing protein [Fluviispira multicolorata]